MTVADVGKGLEAINDEAVRQQVVRGDYGALSHLDLTDDERALLAGAASDFPEVEGFSFQRGGTGVPRRSETGGFNFVQGGRYGLAVRYAFGQSIMKTDTAGPMNKQPGQ